MPPVVAAEAIPLLALHVVGFVVLVLILGAPTANRLSETLAMQLLASVTLKEYVPAVSPLMLELVLPLLQL